MKKLIILFLLMSKIGFSSTTLNYVCTNKKIDENSSYYLNKYFMNVDSILMTATFYDESKGMISEGAVALHDSKSTQPKLVDSKKGKMWSDSGCRVEFYLTKEIMAGDKNGFIKVKAEGECQGEGAWLSCFKLN